MDTVQERMASKNPLDAAIFLTTPLRWTTLLKRETWIALFTYLLFAASTFSISAIELSVVALYALVFYHVLRGHREFPLPGWLLAPFLIWIAVAVLSALVNPDPLDTLANLRHQYRILLPFALVLALQHVKIERLLKVYLLFICLSAVYAFAQVGFAVDLFRPEGRIPFAAAANLESGRILYRARGNFAGTNAFGFLMMMSGLLFAGLAASRLPQSRRVWGLGALLAASGLLASVSRAAWSGAVLGLLVLAMRLPRRWAVAVISSAVVLGMLLIVVINSGWAEREASFISRIPLVGRLAASKLSQDPAQVRFVLWNASIRSIGEKPLLGAGFMNREAMLRNLRPPEHLRSIFPIRAVGDDPHNIYLQVAFYFGLLGLAAFLAIWSAVFAWNIASIRRAGAGFPMEKAILWGTTAGLIGALMDGMFHDNFFGAVANTTILIYMGLSFFAGLRIRGRIAPDRSSD